jgi:Protein of unknown function (DUF3037)
MSDNPKQCDFLLMRYVPDPFKNELVNIGVMLLGRHEDFAGVRFTRDWSRVLGLIPMPISTFSKRLKRTSPINCRATNLARRLSFAGRPVEWSSAQ